MRTKNKTNWIVAYTHILFYIVTHPANNQRGAPGKRGYPQNLFSWSIKVQITCYRPNPFISLITTSNQVCLCSLLWALHHLFHILQIIYPIPFLFLLFPLHTTKPHETVPLQNPVICLCPPYPLTLH